MVASEHMLHLVLRMLSPAHPSACAVPACDCAARHSSQRQRSAMTGTMHCADNLQATAWRTCMYQSYALSILLPLIGAQPVWRASMTTFRTTRSSVGSGRRSVVCEYLGARFDSVLACLKIHINVVPVTAVTTARKSNCIGHFAKENEHRVYFGQQTTLSQSLP